MESLLFFIISGNYNYIFQTIKISKKNYIYTHTINLIEQSKFKSLIKIKVWLQKFSKSNWFELLNTFFFFLVSWIVKHLNKKELEHWCFDILYKK
jgi:hypothetical protein